MTLCTLTCPALLTRHAIARGYNYVTFGSADAAGSSCATYGSGAATLRIR